MTRFLVVDGRGNGLHEGFTSKAAADDWIERMRARLHMRHERLFSVDWTQVTVKEVASRKRADKGTVCHCGVCSDCRGTDRDSFRIWSEPNGRGGSHIFKS